MLPLARSSTFRLRAAVLLLTVSLFGCDHATKIAAKASLPAGGLNLVSGVLELRYTENDDTAFSVLRTHGVVRTPGILLATSAAALLAIAVTWFVRLLTRSVESSGSRPSDACAAFDLIFDLLRRIDEGNDDVFFADEAGSWQVAVAWETVLPAWFACLAKSAGPEQFGRAVARVVEDFEPHASRKHFAAARRVATAAQRTALARNIRAAQQETR